jgi:hypothetical protein
VREAALTALARYGAARRRDVKAALADKDWALRLKAAALLQDARSRRRRPQAIRPAPARRSRPTTRRI